MLLEIKGKQNQIPPHFKTGKCGTLNRSCDTQTQRRANDPYLHRTCTDQTIAKHTKVQTQKECFLVQHNLVYFTQKLFCQPGTQGLFPSIHLSLTFYILGALGCLFLLSVSENTFQNPTHLYLKPNSPSSTKKKGHADRNFF